jgi:exopolyphosphatase/guanosine-5'-triphosphate,3'-diphosphate pyrophosphatase
MIAASLDLGSNTLRLLVAEVEGSRWRELARDMATPRLGSGLDPAGGSHLDPKAKEQALQAAARFASAARELGARRVALAATQACRLAADGREFVTRLGLELDLDAARVLDGREEARLSRLGVESRLRGSSRDAWLADVGGGSTELIPLGDSGQKAVSLPLGAVSLTQAHLFSNPPRPEELAAAREEVDRRLAAWQPAAARRLVSTAGTAATLAAICQGLSDYQPDRLDNFPVSRQRLIEVFNRLAALPLEQRRRVAGLEPERADIILAGLTVLGGLLDRLGLDGLITMNAGLLEGILLDDILINGSGA